jgi:peptide/nickel transport system substrate-binding protein
MSEVNEMVQDVAKAGISRRHFVQGAAAVAAGAALPMTQILGSSSVSAAGKVFRFASQAQEGPAAPWMTKGGSLGILNAVGAWLIDVDPSGALVPSIATKWTGSNGGKTWTFTIRTDAKFHDGSRLTADDVVYTLKTHLDPANKSQSAGRLGDCTSAGIVKVNATTVRFNLKNANANFPYVVSSSNYGLLILKKGEKGDESWVKKMNGAGKWILVSHKVNEKTVFKRNPNYFDKAKMPKFERMEQIQYVSQSAAIPALKTGKLDAIHLLYGTEANTLPTSKFYKTLVPTCGGLHMHMRCDIGQLTDKRVREAIALSLDRNAYIKGVLGGYAVVANDSVMDSFPTVDKSVPQRKKDIVRAKALLKEAGVPNGFKVTLQSWKRDDIDKFTQFVKSSLKQIGIDVTVDLDGSDGGGARWYAYSVYPSVKGSKVPNKGEWLASEFGIAEWAGRPTPDEYLTREWASTGDWNPAYLNSPALDAAIKAWQRALTPAKKKAASSAIQKAALKETPIIVAYNEIRVSVTSNKVKGVKFNQQGAVYDTGRSA